MWVAAASAHDFGLNLACGEDPKTKGPGVSAETRRRPGIPSPWPQHMSGMPQRQWPQSAWTLAVEPPPADLPAALRRAEKEFAGSLAVHARAMESAQKSPYKDVDRAWQALHLLGRCAAERRVAIMAGDRVTSPSQWFKDHKDEAPWLEYAAKESQITGTMYKEERTVTHEGAPLFAEQHLCVGDSFDP